ncbi:hypothetical protein ACVNIS_03330 [Sphaerotilaceae bacterium SBD11-9]
MLRCLTLKASQTDTGLDIRIEDDGQWFDVESAQAQATGKGLSNLEMRARVLGGQLQISSSERGSVIWLRVPFGVNRP